MEKIHPFLFVMPAVLILLGFPIFVVLLATCSLAIMLQSGLPLSVLHQTAFGSVDKNALLAVPFFIFAGEIMARGGLSKRIVNWVLKLTGGRKGGLGLTVVSACTLFGAISGSSPATVATIGKVLHEPLIKAGYGQRLSISLLTSSGAVAVVIPPSIIFILYGVLAEQPIDKLFIAGVVPGLLMSLVMGLYTLWTVRGMDLNEREMMPAESFLRSTGRAIWAIGMPVIILGGIYAGIFSPTECAGIACIYAGMVTTLVYKDLNIKDLWNSAVSSAYLTAQVMIIVAASGVFSWFLTVNGVPQSVASEILSRDVPPIVMLFFVNLLLLAVGCVLDTASAILIFTPLLVPIAKTLGIDLIHFGVIMTVNLAIGMYTPPFGLNIFVAQAMFQIPTRELYKGLLPFIAVNILALAIITLFPDLSLWLVRVLE